MILVCWWFLVSLICFFFFFSSRRRHTRLVSDWSSDVCSSDLDRVGSGQKRAQRDHAVDDQKLVARQLHAEEPPERRSEERRVGKECRSRWSRYHEKKKKRE